MQGKVVAGFGGWLLIACVGGCATPADVGPPVNPMPLDQALALSAPEYNAPYVLAAGDQITVRFFYNPQLDEDLTIRPDGNISLSLIGGLAAGGKSPKQLSQEITQAYGKYLVQPTAVVLVRSFANARVFVAGEVTHPGLIDMSHGYQTALESIASAGGFLETSDLNDVILVRRVPGRPEPIVVQLALAKAAQGADPRQDVRLLPNDLIYVQRSGLASLNLATRLFIWNNFNASTSVSPAIVP